MGTFLDLLGYLRLNKQTIELFNSPLFPPSSSQDLHSPSSQHFLNHYQPHNDKMSIYGCFYRHREKYDTSYQYLPQIGLDVHATILSTTSRALLTQTFVNPSATEPIPEVFYSFPLYDGASIVAFTCRVGDEVIRGKVKPRRKADEIYQKAKAEGQTAALFDRSYHVGDIFKTRVSNVPAGGKIIIEINLVEELKQDAQTNGPRYTIPMAIAPRYGQQRYHDMTIPTDGTVVKTSIKVDVIMEKGSAIRNIRSPSHPIEMSLGRASYMPKSTFEPCYASARLQDNTAIEEDFVLTVNCDNQDKPVAFLETHPTFPNQQALMVSLVPKFSLPPDPSEVVFIIDRSYSMHDKIETLKSALEVFLKSLPLGVPFNIVSFGSQCSALWPRSKISDRQSLSDALEFTKTIRADMGGTEILTALKAVVENRYKDKVLEVLLLTDGEVWNQEQLFLFVNEAVQEHFARFFSLGIGNDASHTLINGIARAGRGFSQSVLNYEELDKKVVRMLKGALMPRLKDCTLDLGLPIQEHEDFVEIEPEKASERQAVEAKKPISFFDESHEDSGKLEVVPQPLPKLPVPAILQAPTELPPLFPFIRSTAFVLLSNEKPSLPEKIFLRAHCRHGPLELEIPVQDIGRGETLHQLAAKRAMTELEESRGWIQDAKTSSGELVREKWESRMDELVQSECERLGSLFQIAGKHCSFVAVKKTKQTLSKESPERSSKIDAQRPTEQSESSENDFVVVDETEASSNGTKQGAANFSCVASDSDDTVARSKSAPGLPTDESVAECDEESDEDMGFALFDVDDDDASPPAPEAKVPAYRPPGRGGGGIASSRSGRRGGGIGYRKAPAPSPDRGIPTDNKKRGLRGGSGHPTTAAKRHRKAVPETNESSEATDKGSTVQKLIRLQTFEGYWDWCDELLRIFGLDPEAVREQLLAEYKKLTGDETDILSRSDWKEILATSLVGLYLETQALDSQDLWELLKDKADIWLEDALEAMIFEHRKVAKELIAELRSFLRSLPEDK